MHGLPGHAPTLDGMQMESLPLFAGLQRTSPADAASRQSAAGRDTGESSPGLFVATVQEFCSPETHCSGPRAASKAAVESSSEPDLESQLDDSAPLAGTVQICDFHVPPPVESPDDEGDDAISEIAEGLQPVALLSSVIIAVDVPADVSSQDQISTAAAVSSIEGVSEIPVSNAAPSLIDNAGELSNLTNASPNLSRAARRPAIQVSVDAAGNRVITRIDRPFRQATDAIDAPLDSDGEWTQLAGIGDTTAQSVLPTDTALSPGLDLSLPTSIPATNQVRDAGQSGLNQTVSADAIPVVQDAGGLSTEAESVVSQTTSAAGILETSSIAAGEESVSEPLTTQISRVLQARVSSSDFSGTQKFNVRLSPPDLGTVQVQVTRSEGGLQVQLQADSDVGQAMLASRVADIRRELQVQQVRIADLHVDSGVNVQHSFREVDIAFRTDAGQRLMIPGRGFDAGHTSPGRRSAARRSRSNSERPQDSRQDRSGSVRLSESECRRSEGRFNAVHRHCRIILPGRRRRIGSSRDNRGTGGQRASPARRDRRAC
ncbi:MAG: flagellar hook-length control protein FliK [Planctomycetaceae bacterium]